MKKTITWFTILFIVLSMVVGCMPTAQVETVDTPNPTGTVVVTPVPTEKPAPTPEVVGGNNPNVDYSKTPLENAEALIEEYEWTGEDANSDRLKYATFPYPEDWTINPHMPLSLYKYVYNIEASNRYGGARDLFRTNKESMTEVASVILDAVIIEATEYNNAMYTCDYQNPKNFRNEAKEHFVPVPELEDFINQSIQEIENTELKQYGAFVTDPSLVYIDIDNAFRVRGIQMLYIEHSALSEEELGEKKSVWLYAEAEYRIRTTQDVANANGVKVWRDDPYSVFNYVYLTSEFREATTGEIALMGRTVGNPMGEGAN